MSAAGEVPAAGVRDRRVPEVVEGPHAIFDLGATESKPESRGEPNDVERCALRRRAEDTFVVASKRCPPSVPEEFGGYPRADRDRTPSSVRRGASTPDRAQMHRRMWRWPRKCAQKGPLCAPSEIEAALGRDVRIIPALVQNAQMPSSDELPETLRPFARRHAVELSDSRWTFDVGKLIGTLERLETGLAVREEAEREKAEREAQERAGAEAQAQAEREAQERAEAEAQAQMEREAPVRAEAEAQDLAPAFDEASSPKVFPDTEPAQKPEVAHSDARPKPMLVDRPGSVRPSWAAKLFGRLDPRGELSWPARLGRVIALTAALIIFVALAIQTNGGIVVLILVVLAVYAVLRRRRGQAK